jgi:hypothetical protein
VLISEILDLHPAIVLSGNQKKLWKAQSLLTEIYQSIGQFEFDMEHKNKL